MNNSTTNTIAATTQDTFNSVFLDMLKGARDAGHDVFAGGKIVASDIYGAGKATIVSAVDFAQTQAPLVVQEFLTWRFSQAVIHLIFSLIVLFVLGWMCKCCIKFAKKDPSDSDYLVVGTFGVIVVGLIFMAVTFGSAAPAIETIVKVKVAPRIYLIEWTTDQIKEVSGKK